MSDDEMDMYEEDEEEMEDEGEEEEDADDARTHYDNGKALIDEDLKEAIESFEKTVTVEKVKGEWGFKALKKLCKLYFNNANKKKLVEKFKLFMEYGKTAVTNNIFEKGLTSVLDVISGGTDLALQEEIYNIAIAWLQQNNERIWFRTSLKFGKLLYDRDEHTKLAKILKDLHKSCQNEQGEDDQKKGSQLVDIYALEIQMYTATKNNKKLKELYHKSLAIRSAIPHPRIMGVIRECGGKMHMREKQWEKAHTDFFEAFKNYDEAGNPRRIQCLKYLVLANMLMLSSINPFEATEAKPYKNDPEIVAMTNLVAAYERNDIKGFEKILKENKKTILDDSFIRDYIDDLLMNIRTQVLLKLLTPYTKIRIPFVSEELGVTPKEVQDIMVNLILDNQIRGRIDQISQVFEIEASKSSTSKKYQAVDKWANQIGNLQGIIVNKLS